MKHDLKSILKAIPLFKTLDAGELAALLKQMSLQDFSNNQPLMVEGHPPPGLFVVLTGSVEVIKGEGDHICDLDAGECAGELEIIENAPCSASVIARGDVKTAVVIKHNLEGYFAAFPLAANKILRQMITVLSGRLHQSNIGYLSLKKIAESLDA